MIITVRWVSGHLQGGGGNRMQILVMTGYSGINFNHARSPFPRPSEVLGRAFDGLRRNSPSDCDWLVSMDQYCAAILGPSLILYVPRRILVESNDDDVDLIDSSVEFPPWGAHLALSKHMLIN